MLIDTHCHINFNAFKNDGHNVIENTLKNGVWMILVGSQIDTSARAVEYARKYKKGVYAAVGLHPIHLTDMRVDAAEIGGGVPGFKTRKEDFDYDKYKKIAENDKVVAIGECGLDYYRPKNLSEYNQKEMKKTQKNVFVKHLDLCGEISKPIMIHCRNADDDLLEILKIYKYPSSFPDKRGQMHFFSGSKRRAKELLDLGFYISFTGVITFTRDRDEIIKYLPLDRMLIETDAPYVAPNPYRGKRNEPLYVEYVARRIAQIKGIDYEKVADQTFKNAKDLYNI